MADLDRDRREMTLVTLTKFAERRTPAVRLRLDHAEQFPPVLLKDRNDPHHHGLPLVLIPEEYGGPGAARRSARGRAIPAS